jgi:hypothetical protein
LVGDIMSERKERIEANQRARCGERERDTLV